MVEPRQRGPLARKPLGPLRTLQKNAAQQLDRGLRFVQSVGTAGQPDLAHAAFADLVRQPPGPELATGQLGLSGRGLIVVLQGLQQQGIKRARLLDIRLQIDMAQQARHGGGQGGIVRAQPRQPRPTLGAGERESLVEPGRHLRPGRAIEPGGAHQ